MYRILIFLFIASLTACSNENKQEKHTDKIQEETIEDALKAAANENKPTVDSMELKKSIKKIEAKYGEQWDFCDCVVKGDSIDKAFKKANLPDKEFDRLSDRFDVIAEKCQAFRIQDANRTPEERTIHEKKVKKCLREAGVKN